MPRKTQKPKVRGFIKSTDGTEIEVTREMMITTEFKLWWHEKNVIAAKAIGGRPLSELQKRESRLLL